MLSLRRSFRRPYAQQLVGRDGEERMVGARRGPYRAVVEEVLVEQRARLLRVADGRHAAGAEAGPFLALLSVGEGDVRRAERLFDLLRVDLVDRRT